MKRVLAMIEKGKAEGATLRCGGNRIGNKGCFVEPTVFTDVTDQMTIAREEVCSLASQTLPIDLSLTLLLYECVYV